MAQLIAFGNLNFAKGTIPHPQGTIQVDIKKISEKGIEATVSLPDNTTGEFWWKGEKTLLRSGMQTLKR